MSDLTARRAEVAAQRRALGDTEVAAASAAVAGRLVDLLAGAEPACIGSYFAADGEVDPGAATGRLREAGWTTWYPVVEPTGPPAAMTFHRWDATEPPPPGRYDLPTPPRSAPGCPAGDLAVVLVPLVLFGPAGARAGRGAGYYDRTFAWLRDVARPSRPLLVGLGHDFQETSELVPNEWDVALDVVVTPTRTIEVSSED